MTEIIEKELDLCDYRERDYSHHRRLKTVEVEYKGEKIILTRLLEYFNLRDHYPEVIMENGKLKLQWKPVEEEREERVHSTGGYVQYFKKPEWSDNVVCQIYPLAYIGSTGQSGYIFIVRKRKNAKVKVVYRYYGWWLKPSEKGYRREEFDRIDVEEF